MFKIKNKPTLKHYTYALISPLTNKPFYIGKGTKKRYLDHFTEIIINKTYNKHKTNTIKQILSLKKDVLIEILFQSNNEKECFDKEIELIELYGRKNNKTGILTNLTNGGEGTSGHVPTKQNLKKMSIRNSGKGNPMFGKQHTVETRQIISKTRKQKLKDGTIVPKKHSEEHKQKLRINNPGGKATSKPIYQIDPETGKIIKEWPSARQAGFGIGLKSWRNISNSVNKYKNRLAGGFYWRWPNDLDIENGMLKNVKKLNFNRTNGEVKHGKSIQQLTLSGELVNTWLSMSAAAKYYNVSISSISLAIKQNRATAGFIWKIIS